MIGELQKRPSTKNRREIRPLTSSVSSENKAQSTECFDKAKQHMRNYQYPEALRHYFNATLHDPRNYKAFCNMGTIFKELRNYKQAKKVYKKALEAQGDDCITLYNYGNISRITGDEELALSLYERVIKLRQQNKIERGDIYLNSCLNMGICYQNMGNYDKALELYDRYIEQEPGEEAGYFNKGVCLLKQISKIHREKYSKVQHLLSKQAVDVLEQALGINGLNINTRIALIEVKILSCESITEKQQWVKALGVLRDESNPSDTEFINMKVKYYNSLIRVQAQEEQSKEQPTEPDKYTKQHKTQQITYEGLEKQPLEAKPQEQASGTPIEARDNRPPTRSSRPPTGNRSPQRDSRPPTGNSRPPTARRQSRPTAQDSQPVTGDNEFDELIEKKEYVKAFECVKNLPEGIQKHEKSILLNLIQSREQEDSGLLKEAYSIYTEKLVQGKEVSGATCSRSGHELCAVMLADCQEFEQASKHYEVLVRACEEERDSQEHKQSASKYRSELALCYTEQKRFKEAREAFRRELQGRPNDYSLVSSIAACYLEEENREEAKKIYQQFLAQNHEQSIEDNTIYIDCLVNITICCEGEPGELEALRLAKNELDRFYPTYRDMVEHFQSTDTLLSMHLRMVELLETEFEKPDNKEKGQLRQQMLNVYISSLEFPNCPDSHQIALNCAYLSYLSGCFTNAYGFFLQAGSDSLQTLNNTALTLVHLQDYQSALSYLAYVVENDENNAIYSANFELTKWICGTSQTDIGILTQRFECKCSHLLGLRSELGVAIIDCLTDLINKQEKLVQKSDSTKSNKQVVELINLVFQKLADNRNNIKFTFLYDKLRQHMATEQQHSIEQVKDLIPKTISQQIRRKFLNAEELKSRFVSLIKIAAEIPQTAKTLNLYFRIFSYFFITFRNEVDAQNLFKSMLAEHNLRSQIQGKTSQFDFQQSASNENDYYTHKVSVKHPAVQLNFARLYDRMKDAACAIESYSRNLGEYIENIYYKGKGVVEPLFRLYRYPNCQKPIQCSNCYRKTVRSVSKMLKQAPAESRVPVEQIKSKDFDKKIQSSLKIFKQELNRYVITRLTSGKENSLYNAESKTLELSYSAETMPFILITHHQTFDHVKDFLKEIDSTFETKLYDGDCQERGVRVAVIHKRVVVQMWWGQISLLDRMLFELATESTVFSFQAVMNLSDGFEGCQDFQESEEVWSHLRNQIFTD